MYGNRRFNPSSGGYNNRIRPSDPHDIISLNQQSPTGRLKAWDDHLTAMAEDLIHDEEDAIKRYKYFVEEIEKFPVVNAKETALIAEPYTKGRMDKHSMMISEFKEVSLHIMNQEMQHRALLKQFLESMKLG